MEQKLSSLPVSLFVDSVSAVEVDLVGPPLITSKSFDLFVRGQFDGRGQHWDLPYLPEKLVLPDVDSRMLLLALSQFSANSAAYVHYKAGFLQYNITDDMIPKHSPIRLNTVSLGIFVPELPGRYPNSPVVLQVSARSAPTVTYQPDSLTVGGSTLVEAFVLSPQQPPISIFQMQADCLTEIDLLLSEEAAGARISVKNFSLSLIQSSVGQVKVENMEKTLGFSLKILLPLVNEHLKNIFPFPANMPRLQNPVIRVLQGYIVIMTDLHLSQPPQDQDSPEDLRSFYSAL
ncbi:bactericidal permeability-increasing protein-like [Hyperolius riggenbachi]|uniref:bactericidal permeability-increasing protein-like n=1 Tax=Hyperolius riggenbachi TaxID=752182 RepID=UPI0035A3D03D